MNRTIRGVMILGVVLGWMNAFSAEIPGTMYAFRKAMMEFQPEIASKDLFSKKENEKEVKRKLVQLSELVDQLKKHERLEGLGFKIPAENIRENMKESVKAFSTDRKSFSWMRLRAAVYGCNQCHMQVGGKQALAWELDQKTLPTQTFALAETWYLFRDYHRAMEFYLSVISKFGLDHVTEADLKTSLFRVLTIALRIDRSPKKAWDILRSVLASEQIPAHIKNDVSQWIDELDKLKKLSIPNLESIKATELDVFVDDILRQVYPIMARPGSRKASALLASGLLLEYVNTHEKEVLPRMLYWLGVSLRDTDDVLFSTSSEHYLKECVKRFQKDPVATVCLSELRTQVNNDYTGSLGTEVPKTVRDELDQLLK